MQHRQDGTCTQHSTAQHSHISNMEEEEEELQAVLTTTRVGCRTPTLLSSVALCKSSPAAAKGKLMTSISGCTCKTR